MKKIIIFLFFLFFPLTSQAICPICTVAVGAGVGLSRWLGIDDTITGLWIGALIVSLSIWTISWFKKKEKTFWNMNSIIFLGYLIIVIIPLWLSGIIGHPFNQLWGVDRLIVGTIIGMISISLGVWSYIKIKEKNGGKAHFPFEKIVFAIAPLIILSVLFYFVLR